MNKVQKDIKWVGSHIEVTPIAKNKKITGTHFPTVLGANPFSSPFEVWCRCTRTYELPFEGNKYTNAGQVIEPKVFDFLRNSLGYGDRLITPEMVYGENPFKTTYGDFFRDKEIYGGMWDALVRDDNGNIEYVVEIKTVKTDGASGTLEDRWKRGKAPDYQSLQASLYAYLLGIDKVMMVAVALKESEGDYDHPEQVVPSFANGNVYIDEFKISERYPNFSLMLEKATLWWERYVLTGISPDFDERKDAEILKALRTNQIENTDMSFDKLVTKAELLKLEIEKISAEVRTKENELKSVLDEIKQYALPKFRDGDTKVSFRGKTFEFTLGKFERAELDKARLEDDGLLDKYTINKTNFRLLINKIKED